MIHDHENLHIQLTEQLRARVGCELEPQMWSYICAQGFVEQVETSKKDLAWLCEHGKPSRRCLLLTVTGIRHASWGSSALDRNEGNSIIRAVGAWHHPGAARLRNSQSRQRHACLRPQAHQPSPLPRRDVQNTTLLHDR